ncbi:MAG: hypothetical protein CSA58_03570 [Micrococcales bacterium]|nr:MAG: hypothetical protein CSA58_03570 [Micrococcales bacterium]
MSEFAATTLAPRTTEAATSTSPMSSRGSRHEGARNLVAAGDGPGESAVLFGGALAGIEAPFRMTSAAVAAGCGR